MPQLYVWQQAFCLGAVLLPMVLSSKWMEDLKSSDPFRFKSLAGIHDQKGIGEGNHNEGILMHVYMKGVLFPGDPTSTLVSKLLCACSLAFLSTKAVKRCQLKGD